MSLRAAVIGLGSMGRQHARILDGLYRVDLIGAFDDRVRMAGQYGELLFRSLDELLAAQPDYCVVAVPATAHEEVAARLVEAGINALIEKPLADTGTAAERIAESFSSAGLVLAVGHIERYNCALVGMRERIRRGQLGDVYQICTRRQGPRPQRVVDVGVVIDLATHDFDLSAWLADSSYSSIAAQVRSRIDPRLEDLMMAVGELANGVATSHIVNRISPKKERIVVALGELGALVADTLNVEVTYVPANTHAEQEKHPLSSLSDSRGVSRWSTSPEPLLFEHMEFRDHLLGVGGRIVSGADGVAAVRVAEACLESSRSGVRVELG